MSNMSYCRMVNTKADVEECIEALRNGEISSKSEKAAAKELLTSVLEFCKEEGIVEDFDQDRVEEVVEECE